MPQVHISTPALTVTLNDADDGCDLVDMVEMAEQIWQERTSEALPAFGPAIGFASQVSPTGTPDRRRAALMPVAEVDGRV